MLVAITPRGASAWLAYAGAVALPREFGLAALTPGVRDEKAVLADYVHELALLYDLPEDEVGARFERFLDFYHRGTVVATEQEWATLFTDDVEHSFIRISKPYRFRHFDVVPEVLRTVRRHLRTRDAPRTLLEFGGGGGSDAIVYARTGFGVHYADLVALRNTEVVRRRFDLRGLDIPVHDSAALPDRRFDVVTAIDVLEHIYDVEDTVAQLTARIATGGLLCCVNAFSAITYDGDHHDKNRVYLELFPLLMEAVGFERVSTTPPLEAYRRVTEPSDGPATEVSALRAKLYAVTRARGRARCEELLALLRGASEVDWAALAVGETASADAASGSTSSQRRSLGTWARRRAAMHAPSAVKRAVWDRRLRDARGELTGAGGAAAALGALADWTQVLRIAEHRLRSLPEGEPAHDGRG
jgi:hypothetical protein